MNEVLRGELLERVQCGRTAFENVERLIAADPGFAAVMSRIAETGLPLVLVEWPDGPPAFREMVATDAGNSEWLAGVVRQVGWPGVSMVGTDGEEATWELAMHADTQQDARVSWMALVDDAVARREVPAEHAELLRLRTEAVAASIRA